MSDIFISYASEDRPKVQALAEVLESLGWSVWWDRAIPVGTQFDKVIEEELVAAKCVVVIWSKASVASQWVRAEAGEALKREVLIPAIFGDVEIPLVFRQVQAARLTGWSGDPSHPGFEKVVKAISRIVGVESTHNPVIQEQTRKHLIPRRRSWVVIGAVATLIAFGSLSYVVKNFHQTKDRKEMVFLHGGAFMMGSTEQEAKAALALAQSSIPTWAEPEQPQHRVMLDPFFMDKFEVTAAEYGRFLEETGRTPHNASRASSEKNHPVTGITWMEADQYCRWAGKELPTEAQWEYAARGGESSRYPWGNSLVNGLRANFCDAKCPDQLNGPSSDDDGFRSVAPAGTYEAGRSAHGIYDLAGNVAEWVWDWYDDRFYEKSRVDNPVNTDPHIDEYKVIRGGSYLDGPYFMRAASRNFRAQNTRHPKIGFRCVMPQGEASSSWPRPVSSEIENH